MAKAAILETPGEGLRIAEVTYAAPGPHEVLIDTKPAGCAILICISLTGITPTPCPASRGMKRRAWCARWDRK
jgi:Zn-dependent alcohol dehydrogenases, class III